MFPILEACMLRVLCAFDELGLAGPQSGPVARNHLAERLETSLVVFSVLLAGSLARPDHHNCLQFIHHAHRSSR